MAVSPHHQGAGGTSRSLPHSVEPGGARRSWPIPSCRFPPAPLSRIERKRKPETAPQPQASINHRGNKSIKNRDPSQFEPSTEIIRKGKASKPTEFGKMVKLQEAENQIITDYE